MKPRYARLAERADYRCEYCRAPESVFNFPFEVEHIVPQSHGGSDDLDNLALSCRACNAFKSAFETGTDEHSQTQVPLYHPRLNIWEQHFSVNSTSAEITGTTPTGRATVTRLQMNRSHQVKARRRWIQLGLFP